MGRLKVKAEDRSRQKNKIKIDIWVRFLLTEICKLPLNS